MWSIRQIGAALIMAVGAWFSGCDGNQATPEPEERYSIPGPAGDAPAPKVEGRQRVWRRIDGQQIGKAEATDARYNRKMKATLVTLRRPDDTTLRIPFHQLDREGRECARYDVRHRRAMQSGRPQAFDLPGTTKITAIPQSPVAASAIPDSLRRTEAGVLLGIDPRNHALGRPPEGWCGEVAIQEALLYHGMYYPQSQINAAGKPAHPDLYSNDIPEALRNLGMKTEAWPLDFTTEIGDFLHWIRKHVSAGTPVVTGVKINPTSHEEWFLDHFVLAVGTQGSSLVLNTTWGYATTLTERQLRSTDEGLGFANKHEIYYGIAVVGRQRLKHTIGPIRIFVRKETADHMAIIVKCENLEPGADYSLYRLSSPADQDPKPFVTFKAQRKIHALHDTISRSSPTIYLCRTANAPGRP